MTTSRYLKDLTDGVIVLDNSGTIIEANSSAIKLLGLTDNYVGKKYADIVLSCATSANDDFHQVVMDSIMDAPKTCRRRVSYINSDGTEVLLQLTSSLMEDEGKVSGLIITLTDITETTNLMKLRERSSYAFVIILSFLSGWIIFYAVWEYLGRPIDSSLLSPILIYATLGIGIFTKFYLKLKPEECGLRFKGIKKVVVLDCCIAVGSLLFLIVLKMVLLKTAPNFSFYCKDNVFFDFTKYKWYGYLRYICSVFAQEFVSRGLIHEQARIVITSKHKEAISIFLSSLIFAAAHVHLGLIYMLGAGVLLGVLGIIYRKQGTIIGLCIPHYVLGLFLGILGFVEF